MGDHLVMAVGLMGSEDPFRNPKGRRLLRVPSSAFRTWLMGVLKFQRIPLKTCVRMAFWQYHLQAFSRVDTRAPGIKSDWCIYSIRAIYDCLAV